jgi:hypothetical protein
MKRRPTFRREGVKSLARTSLVLFAVAVACGGKSVRYVDDDGTGGESGESSTGGRGGSGVDPLGGTSGSFTGGTSGTFPTGGTFPGGTTSTGGTFPVGGSSFTGGTGGTGGTIAVGGSSFTGGTAGVAGKGGCPGNITPPPVIYWDFYGAIYSNQNPYGINGGWYTFDDCGDASLVGLPCTARNPMLSGPDGQRGWAVAASTAVCASGTAPRVQIGPDGAPAYGIQWGFGMGFSLNGGAPFNAAAQCMRGFEFVLTGNAPVTLRINVVTPKTIGVSHFTETALSRNAFVDFASVRQGPWVPDPSPLDVSMITDIQFHVYTNEQAPTPFEFCVDYVRVLR